MNLKAFFVDALARALDLEIATADDVLRFTTPDVLATCLPRPLWARLLTACLGAMRIDAKLVVETIGIANLCEHVPSHIMWACISDIARRSLGMPGEASVSARPIQIVAPPPAEIAAPPVAQSRTKSGPVITVPARSIPPVGQGPLADIIDDLEQDRPAVQPRATGIQPRFRQAQTNTRPSVTPTVVSTTSRRPQAAAAVPMARGSSRRGATDMETETDVSEIAVDDSQLVDWQSSDDNTQADERKR